MKPNDINVWLLASLPSKEDYEREYITDHTKTGLKK